MSDCSIEGCSLKLYCKGLCRTHYQRLVRHGTTEDRPKTRLSLEERFWKRVAKAGDNDCWNWIGSKTTTGYGTIGSGGRSGKTLMAHRVSYQIHHGEIRDDGYVLHSCDNPACVNPSHLRVGSAKENTHDAMSKGRLVNPPAKSGA